MAVVVQRQVAADAAGVLFTADPLSGDRTVTRVEAVRGLGDRLVSGSVTPDAYRVQPLEVTRSTMAQRVLSDDDAMALATFGRQIEGQMGSPQDIDWCVASGQTYVVQSRPITTLFPVPESADEARHVYVSVGHAQMMTDAVRPLGISIRQMHASTPMHASGGVPVLLSSSFGEVFEGWLLVGGGGLEHCEDDVAAFAGEADDRRVVPLSLGAFALVVRLGGGVVLGGDERGKEHRVLVPVVPGPRLRRRVDAPPGTPIDGCKAGVGGEAAAIGEPVGVADLGEGSCSGPGPESAQGHQDHAERVRHEHRFDFGCELFATLDDPVEVRAQIGDHTPHASSPRSVTL